MLRSHYAEGDRHPAKQFQWYFACSHGPSQGINDPNKKNAKKNKFPWKKEKRWKIQLKNHTWRCCQNLMATFLFPPQTKPSEERKWCSDVAAPGIRSYMPCHRYIQLRQSPIVHVSRYDQSLGPSKNVWRLWWEHTLGFCWHDGWRDIKCQKCDVFSNTLSLLFSDMKTYVEIGRDEMERQWWCDVFEISFLKDWIWQTSNT